MRASMVLIGSSADGPVDAVWANNVLMGRSFGYFAFFPASETTPSNSGNSVQAIRAKGKMKAIKRMSFSICCTLDAPAKGLAQAVLGSERLFI